MKFKVMEKARLLLMVRIIRLESASRWGSSRMSSFTRAMSAASTAMSLPTPPHGNAHMGPLQGRSVVDAVPHHADQMAALLAAVDPG